MSKVAILGAGINGLACGVKIKEKYPNCDVTVFSEEFTPMTTGDGCGGLWFPYLCGKTSSHLLSKWGGETYKLFHELWREGGYDISLMPVMELHREERDVNTEDCCKVVFGFSVLTKTHLEHLSKLYATEYRAGRMFTTFVAHPPSILAHLSTRFICAGGRVQKMVIESLADSRLDEFEVVINCLGLGARVVVPDAGVFPIRGQISRVAAPWLTETIIDADSGHYIIPNVNFCVLGGTHQTDDYSREVDPKDTEFVTAGCQQLIPSIESAEVIKHWVGLRPGREQIRLESEQRNGKTFIHNYGHGGSGFTLFWGCGSEVLSLFEQHTSRKSNNSKL